MYLFLPGTGYIFIRYIRIFTFHNVSISTRTAGRLQYRPHLYIPQCIYFSRRRFFLCLRRKIALHSTMYLFLLLHEFSCCLAPSFTFHNVSISTHTGGRYYVTERNFTFHNVSISTRTIGFPASACPMLYIPQCIYFYSKGNKTNYFYIFFTFHNVSISTAVASVCTPLSVTLHSTMYLFLHFCKVL